MKLDLAFRLNVLFRRYRVVDGIVKAEQVGDTWEESVNPNKPPVRYIVAAMEFGEKGGVEMFVDEYDPEFNFRGFWPIALATAVAAILTVWIL